MKLEFKFTFANFVGFAVLGGLFYGLCPLPQNPLWRALVCAGVGLLLFTVCFVVVTHKSFIRQAAYPKQKKRKK